MTVPWYEWRNIRNRLLGYGRAVQGVSPYRTVLEPDKTRCPSGYTNFARRLIMVNPTMFEASPEEQYQLTKAVLCHEAGHRRFTSRPTYTLSATSWRTSASSASWSRSSPGWEDFSGNWQHRC